MVDGPVTVAEVGVLDATAPDEGRGVGDEHAATNTSKATLTSWPARCSWRTDQSYARRAPQSECRSARDNSRGTCGRTVRHCRVCDAGTGRRLCSARDRELIGIAHAEVPFGRCVPGEPSRPFGRLVLSLPDTASEPPSTMLRRYKSQLPTVPHFAATSPPCGLGGREGGNFPMVGVGDLAGRAAGRGHEVVARVVGDGQEGDLGDRRRDAEDFRDFHLVHEMERGPR